MDITITEKAAHQIRTLTAGAPAGTLGLRLSIKSTGCSGNSYKMEYVPAGDDMAGDDIIESAGVRLNIPKMYSWMLIGMTVDFVTDDLGSSKFEFINPNETGRCGCGESFHVEKHD
jgi:iron-sulfur cluster assembly protein